MKRKSINFFLIFFFVIFVSNFIVPVLADNMYGIKDGSEYVWNVTEEISEESIPYQLTAQFNLQQRTVNVTKYFQSNGTMHKESLQMNEFRKYIIASHERHGKHNYFYTGPEALNFPRHIIVVEEFESTRIIEYRTGIVLNYTSELQTHELISGAIPISWVVWIILGVTIGLSGLSLFLIYKKGKRQDFAIVYSPSSQ